MIDIYSNKINTLRIKEYKKLAKEYTISESTVREIFCKGAEWGIKQQLQFEKSQIKQIKP